MALRRPNKLNNDFSHEIFSENSLISWENDGILRLRDLQPFFSNGNFYVSPVG